MNLCLTALPQGRDSTPALRPNFQAMDWEGLLGFNSWPQVDPGSSNTPVNQGVVSQALIFPAVKWERRIPIELHIDFG